MPIPARLPFLIFLVFALALVFLVPPFEAPDEPEHVRYANFVASTLALPNQNDPQRRVTGQGHQAPLYYVLAAAPLRVLTAGHGVSFALASNPDHLWNGGARADVPLFAPGGDPFAGRRDRLVFYALRLLSVVLGGASLLIVARIADLVLADPADRTLAVLVPATLPQLQFVSAYVTADALLILTSTLTAHGLVRVSRWPERWGPWVQLGTCLGLALLTKKTALFLVPGVVIVLLGLAWRRPAVVLRRAPLSAVLAVVVGGGVFVRNRLLYGDVLGSAMERETLRQFVQPRALGDPYFVIDFPHFLGASFVGVLGWMNLWLPGPVYWIYGILGGLVLAGLAARLVRRRLRDTWTAVAGGFALLCLGGIVYFNLTFTQAQGRYLFAALPFLAILAGTGLGEVVRLARLPAVSATRLLAAVLVLVDVTTVLEVRSFYAPG